MARKESILHIKSRKIFTGHVHMAPDTRKLRLLHGPAPLVLVLVLVLARELASLGLGLAPLVLVLVPVRAPELEHTRSEADARMAGGPVAVGGDAHVGEDSCTPEGPWCPGKGWD